MQSHTEKPVEQSSSEIVTVKESTIELFRALGITKLFGNPGSTELPFLDQWPEDIEYILGLQEASVVGMADGYARLTGKASIVNVHSAVGLGHALGNVYTAFSNRAPMVIIAGQQARSLMPNQPFLGATQSVEFPKPYVKYSIEPARAADVPAAIAHAYRIAMQRPQGPTFVSVPMDDWDQPCLPLNQRIVSTDVAPDSSLIQLAAQEISKSNNPVIIIGSEVDEENAGPAMVKMAEHIKAPVMTAPFAARIAFPEQHPQFAGFLPAAPDEISNTLIDHDLILVIGAPVFTYHVAGDSPLMRSGTPIIHLTSNNDTAASAPRGTSILGSVRLSIESLNSILTENHREMPQFHRDLIAPDRNNAITPEVFFYQLGQVLPGDAILMEEAPSFRPILQKYVCMREWGSFFTMSSGGLGYGLPGAVGLSFARPDQRVICLIGDGSFMYSVQAVWTAVQHQLNICFIVVNNGGYGAMRSFSKVLQVSQVPGLDFIHLAAGMGCDGKRIENVSDLDAALDEVLSATKPALLEVIVDPEIQTLYKK